MDDKSSLDLADEREKKAYDALLNYLTASPRSEKECRERLYQKGFHKNEVEFAVDRAKTYRYIDDEEYVRVFLSYYKGKLGKKKLAYKLTSEKGIKKELVDALLDDAVSEEEEMEKCRQTAEKYIRQKRIEDKSGAQKVYAHLYQKGFEGGVISRVMSSLFDVYDD